MYSIARYNGTGPVYKSTLMLPMSYLTRRSWCRISESPPLAAIQEICYPNPALSPLSPNLGLQPTTAESALIAGRSSRLSLLRFRRLSLIGSYVQDWDGASACSEYLSQKSGKKEGSGPNCCFIGLPGVGKTRSRIGENS